MLKRLRRAGGIVARAAGVEEAARALDERLAELMGKGQPAAAPVVTADKAEEEVGYWQRRFEAEGGVLENGWYGRILSAIAGEADQSFVRGKIIADFGCGPRGSLCWATEARDRIGIDLLADTYMRFGIREHNMVYVCSTESSIPLPSDYVDIMCSMNSMDHVVDFQQMCDEVLRVLRPGGLFIASFNLHEPPTPTEPLTLTEGLINRSLLDKLQVETRRTAPRAQGPGGVYRHLLEGETRPVASSEMGYLWVRATKPAAG